MKLATSAIQMVDLKRQYLQIKQELDEAVINCMASTQFIKGPEVQAFQRNLAAYLDVAHVIPCGNGTDALQIALMALNLEPGDEIIIPAFTYIATAEVIALLGLKPVMVDVDPQTFNLTAELIEPAIGPRTKAIIPVHLFGQSADMGSIMALGQKHNLAIIEDNAQAIGADYTFSNGNTAKAGTLGHIGCTSFYPSKNLGCYGDGGAIFTNDEELGNRLSMIANHGQNKLYHHQLIGCNSRLDSLQAAVLNVKLRYLDQYIKARQEAAAYYDQAFAGMTQLERPFRQTGSTHVFHQYTLKIGGQYRDELKTYLKERGVPSMIYYPLPLYKQPAYQTYFTHQPPMPVTEALCQEVLSLPMHTEMDEAMLSHISNTVIQFFESK